MHNEDGVEYCRGAFNQLIEQGRVVGVEEVVEQSFCPDQSDQQVMCFQLYAIKKSSAR